MKSDILIRNGFVADVENMTLRKADVSICKGRISKIETGIVEEAGTILNAEGCIVAPGLIDYHLHLFKWASDHGVLPDSALLPNGVTTAVDAGTSGISTYEAFRRIVLGNTQVRIKAFLNISPMGMLNDRQHENLEPSYFDEERMQGMFNTYPDDLLGIKLRMSLDVNPAMNREVLYRTLEIARRLGKRLVVHVTNPAMDIEELAMALRPGDIFCHMYQGKGQSILDSKGNIRIGIRNARTQGVLFDGCNGRSNFDTDVARQAMEQDFVPDIISTDLTVSTLYMQPVVSLPFIMSKYLAMGMNLLDIIKRCTLVPASLIGMDQQIGLIKEGYKADVAILKLKNKEVHFTDYLGKKITGTEILVPQVTVKDGTVVYRQTDF